MQGAGVEEQGHRARAEKQRDRHECRATSNASELSHDHIAGSRSAGLRHPPSEFTFLGLRERYKKAPCSSTPLPDRVPQFPWKCERPDAALRTGLEAPTLRTVVPEVRYARSGDVSIAYQVVGDGLFDLVWTPGALSHLELRWEDEAVARFYHALSSFSRLITFDKRGTGLSDRVAGIADLETRMDDIRAVMDAAGSEAAAVIGVSEGGPMALLFAATYPERVQALVNYGSLPRFVRGPNFPWGEPKHEYLAEYEAEAEIWGSEESARDFLESQGLEVTPEAIEARQRGDRMKISPGAFVQLGRMNAEIDVRPILSTIRVPTLVLDDGRPLAESNAIIWYLGEGSRFVPEDRYDRAKALQWMFFEQYEHEPAIAVARFLKTYSTKPEIWEAQRENLTKRGVKALAALELGLEGRDWLAGDGMTVADVALYAYTHVAGEGGFELERYPAIGAWLERIKLLPSWEHPYTLMPGHPLTA